MRSDLECRAVSQGSSGGTVAGRAHLQSRAAARQHESPFRVPRRDPRTGDERSEELFDNHNVSPAALPNRLLVLLSALVFAGVFMALVLFERPGLGIGHFFYVAIALLALAIGPWYGAAGGLVATGLFSLAVTLNHDVPTYELFTVSTPIRLVTYVSIGALLGWFASHYQTALAELQVLAERDWLTGLPSMRGFEKAIDGRLATGKPFGLVLASIDGFEKMTGQSGTGADDALRDVAHALGTALLPEDDIARIGGAEFAILCSADSVL